MYYFLMDRNFNLDKYDFDVSFTPRLIKVERDLLNIFLDRADKNTEYTEIKYSSEIFKLPYNDLISLVQDIKKKSLCIQMSLDGQIFRTLFINFFDVIFFEEEKIIYKLSHEFSIAGNSNNFFNRINLIAFLKFDNLHFYNFLKKIMKNYKFKKEITFELTLEELKEVLSIPQNRYTRFYDLEYKVLKPFLIELNKMSMPTYIEKIKETKGKGSRIIGIKVKVINLFYMLIDNDTNKLLREYAKYIDNFVVAYENVFLYRKVHTYEECKKYIEENLDNLSNDNFVLKK